MAKRGKYEAPRPKAAPARWQIITVAALALLLCVTVGIACYMQISPTLRNRLEPAQVSCQIRETYENNQKTQILVENTSSVPVYIRLRLVSYWQTPSGSIAGRSADTPVIPAGQLGPDWVADPEGSHTYYYTRIVARGAMTADLLAEGAVISLEPDSEGYIRVVKLLAEAIQAEPAQAVTTAWGWAVSEDKTLTPAAG